MVYDYDTTQNYIVQLNAKLTALQIEADNINKVLANFNEIQTRKVKTPQNDGSITISDVIPTDVRTGVAFTDATRDAIFDANKTQADALLA